MSDQATGDRGRRRITRFSLRLGVLAALFLAVAAGLLWRAVQLQVREHDFLAHQGELRSTRTAVLPARRGWITDRHGEPLAVSTRMAAWQGEGAPTEAATDLARLTAPGRENELLAYARGLEIPSNHAGAIQHADAVEDTYHRYYPAGEVTGHLLGFTSAANAGQEGLERAFNSWLAGQNGVMRVRQDARGHIVQELEQIRPPRDGRNLALSIDLPLQQLAYEALEDARQGAGATAGSVVLLDVNTFEVLAMVSQPSYNPNMRAELSNAVHRNHAATDLLEPGSTVKPFLVAAALADGRYTKTSRINTAPGFLQVGSVREQDEHNLGVIDLPTVLARSSNVGMARLALSLPAVRIWQTLEGFGFGQAAGSGFPGEPSGRLPPYRERTPVSIATLSHGYGLSVTPLQLARAYATLGALGVTRPVSLVPVTEPPSGRRVLPQRVCRDLLQMLESVVAADGATGRQAAIPGYRVAGKTGTVEELHEGRYDGLAFTALFAGVAPASHPRLAVVVVVEGVPVSSAHQGGAVAAPVFARVMGAALARLHVPPDGSARGQAKTASLLAAGR